MIKSETSSRLEVVLKRLLKLTSPAGLHDAFIVVGDQGCILATLTRVAIRMEMGLGKLQQGYCSVLGTLCTVIHGGLFTIFVSPFNGIPLDAITGDINNRSVIQTYRFKILNLMGRFLQRFDFLLQLKFRLRCRVELLLKRERFLAELLSIFSKTQDEVLRAAAGADNVGEGPECAG